MMCSNHMVFMSLSAAGTQKTEAKFNHNREQRSIKVARMLLENKILKKKTLII